MRRPLLIAAVIVTCLGGYYFATTREASPKPAAARKTTAQPASAKIATPEPPPPAPPPPVAAQPTPPAPAPRPDRATAPAIPLREIKQPAEGTPVRDLLALLRDAADQGVPQAACRLGIELIKCSRLRTSLIALGDAQKAAAQAPKNTLDAARLMQRATELARNQADDNRACSGVAREDVSEAWRYIFAAANAGSVAATSRFVRDPGLAAGDPDAAAGWSAYRHGAPDLLRAAIKGGDVRALYQAWAFAFTGQSPGGTEVFARDPDKALEYGTSVLDLLDAPRAAKVRAANDNLVRELGNERAEAARREGEKLRAGSFASAKPPYWTADDGVTELADCWK